MPNSETKNISVQDPKERILVAAIDLFAKQGFGGTGVREIAAKADVNLAMVSYYFGSKRGLLEAIFDRTFDRLGGVVTASLAKPGTLEQRVRSFFHGVLHTARDNLGLIRITLTELHHEDEEIAEHKAQHVRQLLLPAVQGLLEAAGPGKLEPRQVFRIGPAMIGMIAFHFLTAPVFARATGQQLDDAFYEGFADQLADLALDGINGVLAGRARSAPPSTRSTERHDDE